jgi:hypothetical protein
LHHCSNYTRMNPVNAGLCAQAHLWPWSSAHVAQASSPAGSSTVPVREPESPKPPANPPRGETPALQIRTHPTPPPPNPSAPLLKSARDIMRKDKGLNGGLDRLPLQCSVAVLGCGFQHRPGA